MSTLLSTSHIAAGERAAYWIDMIGDVFVQLMLTIVNPVAAAFVNNRISQDVDMVTVRLNYRFGGYGAPPDCLQKRPDRKSVE